MSYRTQADLGGRTGFGAVQPELEGELFHADWEPRALALVLAMGATGSWNIDASRAVRETLPHYLQLSYYRIWLTALERLMIERGQLFEDEIAQDYGGVHLELPARRAIKDERLWQLGRVAKSRRQPVAELDGAKRVEPRLH